MTETSEAFRALRNRVQCLYLELDPSIVRDIMAAVEDLHAAITAPAPRPATPSAPDSAQTPDLGAPEGPATAAGGGEPNG